MKIELKNVKHAKFASEETDCFEASVYIDGKKAGTVSNDGRGGPNRYLPNTLYMALDDHAKTLPMYDLYAAAGVKSDKTKMVHPDPDTVISELFNDHLRVKDEKRLCAKQIVYRIPGQQYKEGEYHVIKAKYSADYKRKLVAKHGPDVFILNDKFTKVD